MEQAGYTPQSTFCRLPFKAEQWYGRGSNSIVPQITKLLQAVSV
jgi:hypothetical protein